MARISPKQAMTRRSNVLQKNTAPDSVAGAGLYGVGDRQRVSDVKWGRKRRTRKYVSNDSYDTTSYEYYPPQQGDKSPKGGLHEPTRKSD